MKREPWLDRKPRTATDSETAVEDAYRIRKHRFDFASSPLRGAGIPYWRMRRIGIFDGSAPSVDQAIDLVIDIRESSLFLRCEMAGRDHIKSQHDPAKMGHGIHLTAFWTRHRS